jgi:hypothetical protein
MLLFSAPGVAYNHHLTRIFPTFPPPSPLYPFALTSHPAQATRRFSAGLSLSCTPRDTQQDLLYCSRSALMTNTTRRSRSPSAERQPLLAGSPTPTRYSAPSRPQSPDETDTVSIKNSPSHRSRAELAWILAGLWSAVFLGALDGLCFLRDMACCSLVIQCAAYRDDRGHIDDPDWKLLREVQPSVVHRDIVFTVCLLLYASVRCVKSPNVYTRKLHNSPLSKGDYRMCSVAEVQCFLG